MDARFAFAVSAAVHRRESVRWFASHHPVWWLRPPRVVRASVRLIPGIPTLAARRSLRSPTDFSSDGLPSVEAHASCACGVCSLAARFGVFRGCASLGRQHCFGSVACAVPSFGRARCLVTWRFGACFGLELHPVGFLRIATFVAAVFALYGSDLGRKCWSSTGSRRLLVVPRRAFGCGAIVASVAATTMVSRKPASVGLLPRCLVHRSSLRRVSYTVGAG